MSERNTPPKKPRKNSLAAKAEQAASAHPEPQDAPIPVPAEADATPVESAPLKPRRPKKGKAAAQPPEAASQAAKPEPEGEVARPAAAPAPAVKEIKRRPPPRPAEEDRPMRPSKPPQPEKKAPPPAADPEKKAKVEEVALLLKGEGALPEPPGPTPEEETQRKARRTRTIFAVLFPACALLLIISLFQYIRIQQGYSDAQSEYDALAQEAFPDSSEESAEVEYIDVSHQELMMLPEEERPMTLLEVMDRNEDCVAWIEIPETQVNYPLVQGADNDAYLNRTFLGNVNSAGAIFLDYRNEMDMSSLHSVIYGHNMRNGSMFGGLYNFLDTSYIESHPNIYIHNGSEKLRYRIVGARVSDKWDAAYRLDFADAAELDAFFRSYGAPAGTQRVLTLSTCTDGPKEERVLVHAVYEGTA